MNSVQSTIPSNLAICTRFHDGAKSKKDSLYPYIVKWLKNVQSLEPKVIIIAVATEFDKHNSVEKLQAMKISNLLVVPVGNVKAIAPSGDPGSRLRNSSILNSIIYHAVYASASHMMMMSIHHSIQMVGVQTLCNHFDGRTICVGPTLYVHADHFEPGNNLVVGHGGTCPINTLMIWDLQYLGLTGYPLIIDAPQDPTHSENEELVAIACMKDLFSKKNLKAKLVNCPSIERDEGWYELFPDRENKYTVKGKTMQMHWQCKMLGLPIPTIMHIN